ncbi:methionyl-tRNA formyltransferase [Thermosediminibacter oceani]|uniref:Methionyl-tRNA formyltransferase n=1 Tax=Thermosediminibacter oceani (strain ATCC BAA-1034 / DSM 16646 / JW/IW-1228P) TaxID=555079 RepID=D9S312_THEOJ|nr:methionyl-tRNA formyltransferase [Thermosediminibacter oceani]ADL07789.1 methionyl-tRNA formyltransferase [Thermosediminibacter oceani DSM 16646]
MKIVFMGTPEFALPSLNALVERGHNVTAVVTQPDRPKGRKRIPTPPPVKLMAQKHGIRVYQPEKVKDKTFVNQLKALNPDLIVVVAYGQILPASVLSIPAIGCINVHASLLPKYRGAAPIQWAIIKGESKTGVTTMWMDEGMDTGDIFLQKEIEINPEWTSVELSEVLARLGGELLVETLDKIKSKNLIRIPQNHAEATYAPMLRKEDGRIDWRSKTEDIYNLIRGVQPWPGAYTVRSGVEVKIWGAKIHSIDRKGDPGKILGIDKTRGILVGTGDGILMITELQEAGRRRMKATEFLVGHVLNEGELFADEN